MQYIPQHPEDALDPRWKIYDSLIEPAKVHGILETSERDFALELADMVGLKEEHLQRYPGELSGGELQRIVIARALSLNPKFIVCDEPTSMLDVSVQASIVRLLLELRRKFGIAVLFITHDVELAKFISKSDKSRVAVMYKGEIVEEGKRILDLPAHPYTKMLVNSEVPEVLEMRETGCKFYPSCPERSDRCLTKPDLVEIDGRKVRCHL